VETKGKERKLSENEPENRNGKGKFKFLVS